MSAHVLLNVLNELRKSDNMRGLNLYHMDLTLLKTRISGVKTSRFCGLKRKVK